MNNKAKWIDVKGYERLYKINNEGLIKSLNYKNRGYEKELSLSHDAYGYLQVSLFKNGIERKFKVHRLVCENFISNPNNCPCVNHKNEIKDDNRVSNLEWCTIKYNNNYGNKNKRSAMKHIGMKHSEESKIKVSKSLKGKMAGKSNPMYGRKHSKESIEKMIKARLNKGKKVICLNDRKMFNSAKLCAQYYNLNYDSVKAVCQGRTKQTQGFIFNYISNMQR